MEKILLAGANTRAVACSLKKLGYQFILLTILELRI
jgi:predicted ATP-grasp superfamily ATP-dependent carboligase